MPALTTTETLPVAPPKAPYIEGPKNKKPGRPTKEIPQFIVDEARQTQRVPFNASHHVTFEPPQKIVTMKEIGLEGHGISPIAVSDPFPLFSQDAMRQMRAEIFTEEVLENCRFGTDLVPDVIRGLKPKQAPFCFAAWWSPEVLKIVSDIAGIELIPVYDYEVANVNISINDQNISTVGSGDQLSSVGWHYDSYPFVCVTMASDCTGMVGGETAIQLPSGEIRKVRGPAMGTAVVMQGRYIRHQALKAFGGRERIAMVTSFRPKSPFVRDESTILNGIRPVSHDGELFTQYTEYRLEILEERLRAKQKEERRRVVEGRPYPIAQMRYFLQEQKDFLEMMLQDITEPL
ncbi:hypothetical protein FDECE_15457 [Fusarium decemcellulare]|nr:hypothetical protein FDECE_15457 [Fusarium decemcellulare]